MHNDTVSFRGIRLSSMTAEELTAVVIRATAGGQSLAITFVNPHSYNLMSHDPEYVLNLREMDLIFADGIGVVGAVELALGISLHRLSFDLAAPVLFGALSAEAAPVFLIGGREGVASRAAEVLKEEHPNLVVVGAVSGYFASASDVEAVLDQVESSGARLVVLAMGAPAQELIARRLQIREQRVVVITCGGYLDQVIAPKPYYPRWAYPLKVNWLVRLAKEPKRLWRRYLVGNPVFIMESIAWWLRSRKADE